jgi:hypothetical protein
VDRITAAEVRADPRLGPFLEANGFPDPSPAADTYLEDELTLAWSYVEKRTCRDLDALDALDPDNEADVIIARRAVQLRLVQQTLQEGVDYTETVLSDLIKSFSVPGYSETRFDPISDMKANWRLNTLPALHDLLYLLITEECWEKWLSVVRGSEDEVPASTIVEFDWFRLPYRNPGP